MGQTVSLIVDSGKHCPYMAHSDFKTFGFYLFYGHIAKDEDWPDVIGMLGNRFNINLEPLEKVFAPNYKGDEEAWESAAQPPAKLINCLKALVQAVAHTPDVFSEMEIAPRSDYLKPEQLQTERDYFLRGGFLQDLIDLLRKAEWAEENGEDRVRLYYG